MSQWIKVMFLFLGSCIYNEETDFLSQEVSILFICTTIFISK